MLLVDSLYINVGGGLYLLRYLVDELEKRRIPTFYLLDNRSADIFNDIIKEKKCVLLTSMRERKKFYQKYGDEFESVLCFGNVPPTKRLKARVFTYFHNINLLKIPSSQNFIVKLKSYGKKIIYRLLSKNTDFWITQTPNTKNELVVNLRESWDRVLIYPFYNVKNTKGTEFYREGYAFISMYNVQKNFEYLIDVWNLLAERGVRPTLHLTLHLEPESLRKKISYSITNYKTKIITHPKLNHDELYALYRSVKCIVYTSSNESFGLCLIEAMQNGCDIIGPNLPYIHSVCKPSAIFNLGDVPSGADAVVNYEKGLCPKSIQLTYNMIGELIEKLIEK